MEMTKHLDRKRKHHWKMLRKRLVATGSQPSRLIFRMSLPKGFSLECLKKRTVFSLEIYLRNLSLIYLPMAALKKES